ncbi:MAG: hypothetical protein H7Y31_17575 [Chitinophagaceae bacterium]|nr:hypothetical protein [Chitinophagaceae bacterium]
MRKLGFIFALSGIVGFACNSSETPASENYRKDDSGNHQRDNTVNADTSANRGDTSSYQRMQNKTSDSTPD